MPFWQINNSSGDEPELLFYGPIMDSKPWWHDGNVIATDEFLKDIEPLKNKPKLTIRLNSGGGDVFSATSICNQLKTLKAFKTIIIDGVCASAATIIAMAGDVVKIPANAWMMIHNPSIMVWDSFTEKDLEGLRNTLVVCKQGIIESYKNKVSLSDEELSTMMETETWMTGAQAVEKGFADEILSQNISISNMSTRFTLFNNIPFDLSQYKNRPNFSNINSIPKEKTPPSDAPNIKNTGGSKTMTLEDFKRDFPDLHNQIRNDGIKEGQEQERNRLKEIDSIANTISPEILNKARYETPMDARTLAFENAKKDAAKGVNFLNDMKDDADESNAKDVGTGAEKQKDSDDDSKTSEEKVNNLTSLMNKAKGSVK